VFKIILSEEGSVFRALFVDDSPPDSIVTKNLPTPIDRKPLPGIDAVYPTAIIASRS
jgi:hypothetical protein